MSELDGDVHVFSPARASTASVSLPVATVRVSKAWVVITCCPTARRPAVPSNGASTFMRATRSRISTPE